MTLFANKPAEIAEMKAAIARLPGGYLAPDSITSDYLYQKLRAAEAEAQRRLRVFLEPTKVFAGEPTADELAAAAGKPWAEESGYDYEPGNWNTEDWGYLVLRNRFVSSVDSVQFVYPAPASSLFAIPQSWIRLDKKAGHIRFVPAGTTMTSSVFSAFIMSAMYGGRTVPQMIQIRYTAGLTDAANKYPDLMSVIRRMAIMQTLNDTFPAQSGSISADGLSQSNSIDTSKWQDGIDQALDRLRDSLHGPRVMIL